MRVSVSLMGCESGNKALIELILIGISHQKFKFLTIPK